VNKNENLEEDISYIKSKQSPVDVDRINAVVLEEVKSECIACHQAP